MFSAVTASMPLAAWVLGVASCVGAVAGVLIGAIGVGGVIVVPCLIQLPGIDVQRAVAAALFAYIVAGIAGPLAIYAQQRMAWADALWLAAGAIPGAAGGAVAVGYISAIIIKSVLYAVVLLSALFSLYRLWSERQKKRSAASEIADTAGDQVATPMAGPGDAGEVLSSQTAERQAPADPDPTLAVSSSKDPRAASLAQSAEATLQTSAETEPLHGQTDAQVEFDRWSVTTTRGRLARLGIGLATGAGSALTGTSGPVLLLPIVLGLRWHVHVALSSAQLIQLPIATAATLSYVLLRPGTLDFELGGVLAATLGPSIFLGAHLASKVQAETLKIVVCAVLVVSAVALLTQLGVTEAQ